MQHFYICSSQFLYYRIELYTDKHADVWEFKYVVHVLQENERTCMYFDNSSNVIFSEIFFIIAVENIKIM